MEVKIIMAFGVNFDEVEKISLLSIFIIILTPDS
jgi:hypothetical protein